MMKLEEQGLRYESPASNSLFRIPEIVLLASKNRLITSNFLISIYHLCVFQGGPGLPGQAGFPVSTV